MRDKAFSIAKNPKYDRYQRSLSSMVYNFVDENIDFEGVKNENMSNKELTEELHKPIDRKFNKRKVHASFIDNIWNGDLTEMQLIR